MINNLSFTPLLKEIPFQIEVSTDINPTILKNIDPLNFIPDDIFLSLNTIDDILKHNITFSQDLNTIAFRIRNFPLTIPGIWTDSIVLNKDVNSDGKVPFFVDVIPSYTIFSLNLRWTLTNLDGVIFGPFIPTVDNIKYISPGDYTLSLQDLAAKNYFEYQISTIDLSKQIFIDIPTGYLKVILNNTNYTYYLISDFGDITISDKYSNIKYELDIGKYYIIVKYNNKLISSQITIIEENIENIIII